jgi:hypothetical protein
MANRWWIYQRERFPLLAHSPVIAAFSLSAVSYSALVRGTHQLAWVETLCRSVCELIPFFSPASDRR